MQNKSKLIDLKRKIGQFRLNKKDFHSFNLKKAFMAIDEQFLGRLQEQLSQHTTWPAVYMFKFIIPGSNQGYAQLRSLFGEESRLFTRPSSGGKYISVTVKEMMLNPAEIIDRYRQAAEIEGIIAL